MQPKSDVSRPERISEMGSWDRGGLGIYGEDAAARYLEKRGYVILERRWRSVSEEVDLVADDGNEVVFVEVKTRRAAGFGAPEESVTARKQATLCRLAHEYMAYRDLDRGFRIDVVAVLVADGCEPELRHIRNAVAAAY